MKRMITFSLLAVLGTFILASCSKHDYYDDNYNNEGGFTVYVSEVNSPYSVIQMDNDGQYAVVYSVEKDAKYWPLINDVIYGNFSVGGTRTLYNKTAGWNIQLQVDDFFQYKNDAINSVIRKENQEGYAKAFENNPVKIQRRTDTASPAIK